MVELVDRTELAIDEVIEVVGQATIEAVLTMSAVGVAGPKQARKRSRRARRLGTGGSGVRSTCRTGRFGWSGRGCAAAA